ncbi:hypothetical protein [Streptomyces sp. NPDC050585]|uniref:hypothetical protein n=1 Tax=Streptomyces sp. NPDC050585 TaxID=3365632 RepID=UPI0037B11B82
MADRDWYDDSGYEDAVRRAGRATGLAWTGIAAVTGALGCALIAMVVICGAVVLAYISGVPYVD